MDKKVLKWMTQMLSHVIRTFVLSLIIGKSLIRIGLLFPR